MHIERDFWLLAILCTVANGIFDRFRARKTIASNPELKEGYNKVFWWWITMGSIPWIIMGVGIISGVDGTKAYFHPRQGDPFVLAFHASVLLTSIFASLWVFFGGGAEFLVKHSVFFNIKSVVGIKLLSLVGILFWILWFLAGWQRANP
jgi:hypothetical protein